VKLIEDGLISNQIAKTEVFPVMFETGQTPSAIVEEKGLKQSTDTGEIEGICAEVIEKNPKPVKQFKEGKEQAINALKGQVMKATRGKANPKLVDDILRKLLTS
ncbi:MAG: Asp-tRNA(Asn)/Glu-tRNA(Gln) amidotransferase GatCAB subunit B, partial [Verrucomicrobiota bacterium]